MKRRTFILSALGGTGALILGWGLVPERSRLGSPAELLTQGGEVALNGWIKITPEGGIVMAMPRAEMGQGVHTALPMLVAEELDAPLDHVSVQTAGADAIYGNVAMFVESLPLHPRETQPGRESQKARAGEWLMGKFARELGLSITGGSSSVADAWEPVRLAAATARAQLVAAAARRWGVDEADIQIQDGLLRHAAQQAHFGELAAAAAALHVQDVKPKPAEQWRLIGRAAPRRDVRAKVTGQAQFGIDVRLPDMLYAVVRMCPMLHGRLGSLRNEAQVAAMPGVQKIVRLPALAGSTPGVCVVARDTFLAKQAVLALDIEWLAPLDDKGQPLAAASLTDSDKILDELEHQARDAHAGFAFYTLGDAEQAENRAAQDHSAQTLQAVYRAPYLAHATMEPMNGTAQLSEGRLTLWLPTQAASQARDAAARAAGLSSDQVTLNVTLLGGGFGRRLEVDFVMQAVLAAKAVAPRPVKLLWTREEDTTHDFYRPASVAVLKATLNAAGRPQSLRIHSAGDAIAPRWTQRTLPLLAGPFDPPDKTAMEGLFDLPYGIEHQDMRHVATRHGVPIGFWRSVGHSHHAFFSESFIDEMATAAGKDPVQFRLDLLDPMPRYAAVLKLAAQRAGWGTPLPAGRARGVALHESFGSIVAQVAEVSVQDGEPRVHRVVCAIDCGVAVNPDIIAQQMEGSVIFGLSAALYGRIDVKNGAVQQQSFPDYPVLRMAQAPVVETYIVPSTNVPTGVGEPGTPPVAPAVANALFALTGKRQRSLPIKLA